MCCLHEKRLEDDLDVDFLSAVRELRFRALNPNFEVVFCFVYAVDLWTNLIIENRVAGASVRKISKSAGGFIAPCLQTSRCRYDRINCRPVGAVAYE